MKKVLFVCLGNICRSPAAEGVFLKMLADHQLHPKVHVDSAGTGAWHVGDPPDGRMIQHAKNRGYDLTPLRARQFHADDFEEFDLIVTMDESNKENVLRLAKNEAHRNKVQHLTSFCDLHENVLEVPDPYHQGDEGFEYVLDLIEDACQKLIHQIKAQK